MVNERFSQSVSVEEVVMSKVRPIVVAGALMLASVGAGHAADVRTTLPPPPSYMSPAPAYVRSDPWLSGFYLRGDLGGRWDKLDRAVSASPFASPLVGNLDNGVTGGLGVGIKTNWLRTDVTIDYAAPVNYRGTIAASADTTAKIQTTTALLNGYVDLGTWYRVTPYLGAGVGTAYARVSDYASTAAPPFSGDTARGQWRLVWAGMAGFAMPISQNMMADVGYRYVDFGDLSTGSDKFGAMTFKHVAAHELRVGLRWNFDDLRHTP